MVVSSKICFILQYTSIWLNQLSNFSTSSSPLYIGNSNLTSTSNKEELDGFCATDVFGECEEWLGVSGGDEDEGDSGGSPPPPTPLPLSTFPD